jgi:hypothetical protein
LNLKEIRNSPHACIRKKVNFPLKPAAPAADKRNLFAGREGQILQGGGQYVPGYISENMGAGGGTVGRISLVFSLVNSRIHGWGYFFAFSTCVSTSRDTFYTM